MPQFVYIYFIAETGEIFLIYTLEHTLMFASLEEIKFSLYADETLL